MKFVNSPISKNELKNMSQTFAGGLVKAVVDVKKDDFIEFDSMINIRPRLNNFSRGVEDENIRKKIIMIVSKLVK